jgi:hypothetical protein
MAGIEEMPMRFRATVRMVDIGLNVTPSSHRRPCGEGLIGLSFGSHRANFFQAALELPAFTPTFSRDKQFPYPVLGRSFDKTGIYLTLSGACAQQLEIELWLFVL